MSDAREPTDLEAAIIDLQGGGGGYPEILTAFSAETVYVPSSTPILNGSITELSPILFDNDGVPVLATFSHVDQVQEFEETAEFLLPILGQMLVNSVAPGTGIVINPRREVGIELPPFAVEILVKAGEKIAAAEAEAASASDSAGS